MKDPFSLLYSKKVLDHFRHPRNMGVIQSPDGEATVGNPACGDIMKLYIKVSKKGKTEFIKDIKFQTLGCGAAIATSSMITSLVKGKTLKQAEKMTKDILIKALEWLPPVKVHCSVLADTALKKAIRNYRDRR